MDQSIIQIPQPDHSSIWECKEYGIRADEEFERYTSLPISDQGLNLINTNLNGLFYTLNAGYKRISSYLNGTQFPQFNEDLPIGKTHSLGLVVFFHGLHGQPFLWDGHVELLKKYPSIDVYAPEIPEAGVCDLKDVRFSSLLERIISWTIRNPLRPIALFGQSNGSRVALHFECLLRERVPQVAVHVSLTAGVLFGSKMVQATDLDVLHSYVSDTYNIYRDLKFGSEASKQLLAKARLPLAAGTGQREYHMYAAYHDHHVYSLGSALPVVNPQNQPNKLERHYIVFNYGHNAAPLGLIEKQIQACVSFILDRQLHAL